MISGKNIIGNKLSKQGDVTYKTFNPKTNKETNFTFYEATSVEINEAVELASEAYKIYKDISGSKKADFLEAIALEIEALGDELIETYCKESGLPEGRSYYGPIKSVCGAIERRFLGRGCNRKRTTRPRANA